MIFDKKYLRDTLTQLPPDTVPLWGTMTPQHMVEHLRYAVQLSNGKVSFPLVTPLEKVEKAKARMLAAEGWQPPVNFKAAFMDAEGLMPLQFGSMEAAIDALLAEIDDFYQYHRENPDAQPVHPYFGALNQQEWEINHDRHFQHHFRQFGVKGE